VRVKYWLRCKVIEQVAHILRDNSATPTADVEFEVEGQDAKEEKYGDDVDDEEAVKRVKDGIGYSSSTHDSDAGYAVPISRLGSQFCEHKLAEGSAKVGDEHTHFTKTSPSISHSLPSPAHSMLIQHHQTQNDP
jgi:hypothetical protein